MVAAMGPEEGSQLLRELAGVEVDAKPVLSKLAGVGCWTD